MRGSGAVLHVTNGDSAAQRLMDGGLPGDVLPWRDVLHEGPVPEGTVGDLRQARAAFLAEYYGAPQAEVLHDMSERDERLERALRSGEEIVLWFETDLYDQLQLIDVARRSDRDLPLVLTRPGEIDPALAPTRSMRPATAQTAWAAFTASTPVAWPSHPSLRRLCEELPWATDGLTRSERQLLQAVADGALSREEAFLRAQTYEEEPYLGDLTAWKYLDRMEPLVTAEPLALTPLGKRLLTGGERWLDRPAFPLGGLDDATHWSFEPASATVAPRDG